MRNSDGLVVGTAGHIDHGKTSLVRVLTGIDTDRLKEEKERGISIDLGFAEMQLPNGKSISFVDVPGHERFVRNMLAGAAGIEAVLLIVAANESVKPQTREHFAICRILNVQRGIVVLTKCDIATAEQIEQTRADVRQLVIGSFLEDAPVIPVSTVTKDGIPELIQCLSMLADVESARNTGGAVRLPIDRAFAMKGFGVVVTGTLISGTLSVGDVLELLPQNAKVRVRGLQARHTVVNSAGAGQRLAVNLTGIDLANVKRGDTLATAGALKTTSLMGAELRLLEDGHPTSARELLTLHIGTSETSARVVRLKGSKLANLHLLEEVVALPGDHFVVRRPSPPETVGGGTVIDAAPPRRLNQAKSLIRLQLLEAASLAKRIELLLDEVPDGRKLDELVPLTGALRASIDAAIASSSTVLLASDQQAVTRHWLNQKRQALLNWLREFHASHPNTQGAPLASARLGMEQSLAGLVFKLSPEIRINNETVALVDHQPAFANHEMAALQKIEAGFRQHGFQPPTPADAMASSGIDQRKARELLESLIKQKRLIRVSNELIFHADVIAHVRTSLAQHIGRRFSVAEFKSWTNISRKFAIPLLEYLDQQRVTKREGDVRIVL